MFMLLCCVDDDDDVGGELQDIIDKESKLRDGLRRGLHASVLCVGRCQGRLRRR